MKTSHLKWIAYPLAALMLMQSCVIYHKTPNSIDEAVASNSWVKVRSSENKHYKFRKLLKEDDTLYGVSLIYGKSARTFDESLKAPYGDGKKRSLVKMQLPFEVAEVYTKNKRKSKQATWVSILFPVITIGAAIGSAFANFDLDIGG